MKKLLILLIVFCCFQTPIDASYIVMAEGQIIEGEDIHQVQSVASISKVMTALVALEHVQIGEIVTIDDISVQQTGSSLYLNVGEKYSLLSLLYGLMLRSGNDAAYAIALFVGKNQEKFVEMMNKKAKELGMKDTIFRNPSGLDEIDGGNTSSVYDMALCMSAAMKNKVFRLIVNTRQYKAENNRVWLNKNRLLNEYEYANGGKTGYTTLSGKTLITSAYKDGLESIVVSFREGEYWRLHQQLHQKTFDRLKATVLIKKGYYRIKDKNVLIEEDVVALSEDEHIQVKMELSDLFLNVSYSSNQENIVKQWSVSEVKQ